MEQLSAEILQTELSIEDRKELERNDLRDFVNVCMANPESRYIRITAAPGVGKSYVTASLPSKNPDKKFLFVVPNHDLAQTVKKHLESFNTPYVHVVGKRHQIKIWDEDMTYYVLMPKPCERKKDTEYFPGCSDCPMMTDKSCEYFVQFELAAQAQVVITTIHNVKRLGEGRIIVYDESFDTQLMDKFHLCDKTRDKVVLGESNDVAVNSKKSFTFYDNPCLVSDFEVKDERTYFLSKFWSSNRDIHAMKTKKGIFLFGRRKIVAPDEPDKIIFACATTSNELMAEIVPMNCPDEFKLAFWDIYEPKYFNPYEIINPTVKFHGGKANHSKAGWTKRFAGSRLAKTFDLFKNWMKNRKILVVTKKDFEPSIQKYLPHADLVHYGNGRGFNNYNKPYHLVIVYGRYGLTPLNYAMMDKLGFKKKTVQQMEISEMMQCIHRVRPLMHPNTPIMLMSDADLFKDRKPINIRAFDDFHANYDHECDIEYENMSLKKLSTLLGVSINSRDDDRAREYVIIRKFMDDIIFRDDLV